MITKRRPSGGSSKLAWVILCVPVLTAACTAPEPALESSPRLLEWPQFRGPGGLGVSGDVGLPTTWSAESTNLRWRAEIPGSGNSSPVVSDGLVVLTHAVEVDSGELERAVLGLDLATGEVRWRTVVLTAAPDEGHFHNTNAAPTPATDGERTYVYFGSVLACLDRQGTLLWRREVDPRYHDFVRYGVASSPVLAGDVVILAQDKESAETDDVGWLAAFDRDSGEEIWRREWTETCCSYATPMVWEREGETELVFAHSGRVTSYRPDTGDVLWEHTYGMLQTVASPVIVGDLLCVLSGAHQNKGNLCLRVSGRGAETRAEELWHEPQQAPESASPVLYGGKIFTVTDGGVMSCFDPESGARLWRGRLKEGKGYRSSLVAADDKVYAVSTWGITAVVDAKAKKLKVLAFNQLDEGGNNATPAIAGGCLLLRTSEGLYCIEKEGGEVT